MPFDEPRTCGGCAACCKVPAIEEPEFGLMKPPFQWCEHCKPGADKCCSVYERRPPTCVDFKCLWLENPKTMPQWLRPDRSKVCFVSKGVIAEGPEKGKPSVAIWEMIPGALQSRRTHEWMKAAAERNSLSFSIANIWGLFPNDEQQKMMRHSENPTVPKVSSKPSSTPSQKTGRS